MRQLPVCIHINTISHLLRVLSKEMWFKVKTWIKLDPMHQRANSLCCISYWHVWWTASGTDKPTSEAKLTTYNHLNILHEVLNISYRDVCVARRKQQPFTLSHACITHTWQTLGKNQQNRCFQKWGNKIKKTVKLGSVNLYSQQEGYFYSVILISVQLFQIFTLHSPKTYHDKIEAMCM